MEKKISKFIQEFLSFSPQGSIYSVARLLNQEEHEKYKGTMIRWSSWHFWYYDAPKSKTIKIIAKDFRSKIGMYGIEGANSLVTGVIARESGGCVFVTTYSIGNKKMEPLCFVMENQDKDWALMRHKG